MTATRIGRLATVVVFVARPGSSQRALLWRTSVPSGLDVGGLDVHRFFSARALEPRRATTSASWTCSGLLHVVATIVALVVLRVGARRASCATIGLGRIGAGVIVAMLMLVTLWFVSLPFGFAAQWWDARHGLAPHDYVSWIFEPWALLSFEALFALVAVVHRARPRRLARRPLVARRRAGLRRRLARAFAFLFGYVAPVRDARRHSAARCAPTFAVLERREGVPRHAGARPGRQRRDESGERVLERLRPVGERRPLEHAARRPLHAGRGPRRRRARARPRRAPPRAQGDRLDGAARRCRSRGSSRSSRGAAAASRTRRASVRAARARRARACSPRRS